MTKTERERFARNADKVAAADRELQTALLLLASTLPQAHHLRAAVATIREKSRLMRTVAYAGVTA